MAEKLAQVDDVDIDPEGTFKYILINISTNGAKKKIVRGYSRCGYHSDILDEVTPELKKLGIKAKCEGGGRIQHDASASKLNVYGYSQGFGKAKHEISVEILKKKYPNYEITWSDDGY